MRAVTAVLALAGCHVTERDDIVRPGARERVRHPEHPTPRRPTLVLTDAGMLRFVEPL